MGRPGYASRHAATGRCIRLDRGSRASRLAAHSRGTRPAVLLGVTGPGAAGRLAALRTRLHEPGTGRSVVQTAGFNIVVNLAGTVGGVIVARAAGPTARGEYSAATAWLGITLMLGELGLPIALCFYVAHDQQRAQEYVATSRTMLIITGATALGAGMVLAPVLARGNPGLTLAYRIAFASVLVTCVGDGYQLALMGRDLKLWNKVRLGQPLAALVAVVVLWRLGLLTLDTALAGLLGSAVVQFGWSYWGCRQAGLAPGRPAAGLVRPLVSYGFAQIAAMTPASLNAYLDQLVLSVTVPPADLARYSIAVSMTLLPSPLVSAIGYVLLPKLAAQEVFTSRTHQLQRNAVLVSFGLATAILLPLALVAPWLVPFVFGPGYRGAVQLFWILAPGGVFLCCGQVVTNMLRGRKRQMLAARAEGVAVVFTLGLLGALLPVMGVTGAAIASTVPYGISLALMLRWLWRLPHETDERAQ